MAISACNSKVLFKSTVARATLSLFASIFILQGCSSDRAATVPVPQVQQGVLADKLTFQTDQSPVLNYSEPASANPIQALEDPSGLLPMSIDPSVTTGGFTVGVTDAPNAGMDSIRITFSRIDIRNQKSGAVIPISGSPVTLDLLTLRDGIKSMFSAVQLPAGIYNELRFYISAVTVAISGKDIGVAVPVEFSREGLRLWGTFQIKAGASADATIDFDVSKMFHFAGNNIVFRPIAKLRHLHFVPTGIHFEQVSDGSVSLIGPAGSVRSEAFVQMTDASGEPVRKRAGLDGSFRFDGVSKVAGNVELAVVEHKLVKDKGSVSKKDNDDRDDDQDDQDKDHGKGGGAQFAWIKLAWMNLLLDFSVDARFPRINALNLDALLRQAWLASGSSPEAFISGFGSDAFRFLAGKYVESLGQPLPASFVYPSLSVPYAFALEGPDYELPQYTFSQNSIGYFSGGPSSAGCADARIVFEGAAPSNDYASLSADEAMARMLQADLPFTGLLAEYEAVCRGRDLAALGCGTLGSLARGGNSSLPAESLAALERDLNGPRGGLLVALLSCVRPSGFDLGSVNLASFPASQPGCWYGCGDEAGFYVPSSQLLSFGTAGELIGDAEAVADLDSLVLLSDRAGVPPLVLAASYLADHASSAIRGIQDRSAPKISNILPPDGTLTTEASVQVSAKVNDRALVSFTVNGVSASFQQGPDGSVFVAPFAVGLVNGSNLIELAATDASGNVGTSQISVTALLGPTPSDDPSPTPTPSEEPSPTPTPTEEPSPTPTPTEEPSPTPTPTEEPSPTPTPTEEPSPIPTLSPSPDPVPSPTPTGIAGIDPICAEGAYVPKITLKLGVSVDALDGSYPRVIAAFTGLGLAPIVYSHADVAAFRPISDGITVLAISRVATRAPVSDAYIEGVKAFIAQGGSVLGEFDGAALFFTRFSQPTAIVTNFTPSFGLISGSVTGGGALLPLVNSTTYVSDPNDPLMAGIPSSFVAGGRAAFAVVPDNTNWLHEAANFTSAGYQGLIPVGTYPAVLSGRCGQARIALYTLNYLNAGTVSPINTMLSNTLNWLVGP